MWLMANQLRHTHTTDPDGLHVLKRSLNISGSVIGVWQPEQGDTINGRVGFPGRDFHAFKFHEIRVQLIGDLLNFHFDNRVQFFSFVQ